LGQGSRKGSKEELSSSNRLILAALAFQEGPSSSTHGGSVGSNLLGVGAVFLLVALNAFFVAAEFSLVSSRQTRLVQLAEQGSTSAKAVQKALSGLDNYIAATQLGVTLASLSLGWVGEPALEGLIEPPFVTLLGSSLGSGVANGVSIFVTFLIITTLEIILGELAPKSAALQRAEPIAMFIIRPLNLFLAIFKPFIWLLNRMGSLVLRIVGLSGSLDEHSKVHSVEELELLIRQSHQAGVLDAQEESLLRRVFEFDDKTARQIMMPRTEISGVPENATLDELIDRASDERYTRFPVYRETLDNIVGVIHVKDLFPLLREREKLHNQARLANPASNLAAQNTSNGSTKASPPLQNQNGASSLAKIIRPVLNVPESIHVADLLTQMRVKQAHLAVVIDEYGGTSGIVTLEDVLEELIGELQDEFDTDEEDVTAEIINRPDGTAEVSGLVPLTTIEEVFNLTVPEEQAEIFDTVGGYVMGALGRVPVVGDHVHLGNYRLSVTRMDGLRVERMLMEPLKTDEAKEEAER
jgi:CBS domain containing-hemolysin-like protein